jgi:integrase
MAFRMAGLERTKSGAYKARKGIPKDIRGEYQTLYGKGWEELFNLPPGQSAQRAKVLFSEWQAEIDSRIAALRAKQRGEGRDLTQREAHALAGEWYRWFVGLYEENPGETRHWARLAERLTDAIMDATPWWDNNDPEFEHRDRAAEPEAREVAHPMLADEAKTAQFLASKGEALTPDAMVLFLDSILPEFLTAVELLRSRAAGSYVPDTHQQSFPEYRKVTRGAQVSGKTCFDLLEAYVKAVKPAASTVNRWRVIFVTLDEVLAGRGIDAFSPEEAQHWATSLVTDKRGARTVSDIWVTGASTVLAWALKQKLVAANPFAEVSVRVPRKVHTRETKEFTAAEQQTILKAALAIEDTKRPFNAACRWVPWLCAYSGARAGEMTQLRGSDIELREGFAAMKITPEAGSTKSAKPRTVPIHEHVIDQGFLDYVKSKGRGPLFYTPDLNATDTDVINPRRPRAVKARERLAGWVREIGVTDKEISPTHAWRHTFKRRAARARIEKGVRDFICGHATKSVGDHYETPSVEDMANALRQFPRYAID